MNKYPHFIPVAEPDISGNELKYVTDCIESGWISSLGKYVTQFETGFAKFCGTKYAISVCNGTVALHLTLVAMGIGAGDEVIVPTLTFVATANSVLYAGATPIFVDSERETWNMDPAEIEKKITKKTKAIIVVHLYGHPANMDAIMKIARRHKLFVIEDAAEAHGAMYKKKMVGSIGDAGCFSYYGNKTLTTGEGGLIALNKKSLADKMHFLKDHAMTAKRRYYHPVLGYNYRMTNVAAALGVAQLEKVNQFLKRKREIAALYNSLLKNVPGVELPPEASWAKSSYWMYSIVLKPEAKIKQAQLMKKLKALNIDSRPFFIPNHTFPYFTHVNRKEKFPVAEYLGKNGINLPSSVLLKNEAVEFIAKAIRSLLSKNPAKEVKLVATEDRAGLLAFFKPFASAKNDLFQPHPFDKKFVAKICSSNDRKSHIRVIAKDKKKVIGYAFLSLLPLAPQIGYFGIAVTAESRGQGVGGELMEELMRSAKQRRVRTIYLNVVATNSSAIHLYEKFGFEKTAEPFLITKLFTLSEKFYAGEVGQLVREVLMKTTEKKQQSAKNGSHAAQNIWMKKSL